MTIIDGHNLYHALDRVDEFNFEKGLSELVDDLRRLLRWGRFILVLDGSGGGDERGSEKNLSEHLRLVYSGANISADDWIERWNLRLKCPTWELVSGDRRLYERLRRKGITRSDPEAWYKKCRRKARNKVSPVLDPRQAHQQGGKKTFGKVDEWLEYFGES